MILITRPKDQSRNLKSNLEKKGHDIFQEGFYKIQYLKQQVSHDPNTYYIFSSIHSVISLKKNNQILKFRNSNILVIGLQVKKLLKELKKNYTYFCSNIINDEFFNEVRKKKINIRKEVVYKTIGIDTLTKKLIESFQLNKIKGVIFYSQLSVKIYIKLLKKYKIFSNSKSINIYCLSERVAKPLRNKNFDKVYVAKNPNERSLISAIKKNQYY